MKLVKQLLRNPLSLFGIVLLLFFGLVAIFAPWLAPPPNPFEPYRIAQFGYSPTPKPPTGPNPLSEVWKIVTRHSDFSKTHPFGTTEGQYDVYYGIVWGTRTAFLAGICITGITALIGIIWGSLAAYFGGWMDMAFMRITDIFQAFPFLIAAMTIAAVLQPRIGRSITTAAIALIVFGWMGYSRLIRGDILSIKERDYVQAARAAGAGHLRIVVRHILPNAIYPTLVVASMDIGSYVISFAALSFLGLGAEVGYADWGQMLSFARNWIPRLHQYWWIILYPGLALILFVLAWNLVGDALRDILDPRLRGRIAV
ncbi:MAG: ABC transporter permease [Candidatus Bipolaricaulota bacterium]|nr:ABC transporter permease [Candidatus Bipolaricaulota bacterium]MDW8126394.1 ABC transporter permease [Candidatus Bipolaricaulota bacterium]